MNRKPPLRTYGGRKVKAVQPTVRDRTLFDVPGCNRDGKENEQDEKEEEEEESGNPMDLDRFEDTFDRLAKSIVFHHPPELSGTLDSSSFLVEGLPEIPLPSPVYTTYTTDSRPKRKVNKPIKYDNPDTILTENKLLRNNSRGFVTKKPKVRNATKRKLPRKKKQSDKDVTSQTSSSDSKLFVVRTRGIKRMLDTPKKSEPKIRSLRDRRIISNDSSDFSDCDEKETIVGLDDGLRTSAKEIFPCYESDFAIDRDISDLIESVSIKSNDSPQSSPNEIDCSQKSGTKAKTIVARYKKRTKNCTNGDHSGSTNKLSSILRRARSRDEDEYNSIAIIQDGNNGNSLEVMDNKIEIKQSVENPISRDSERIRGISYRAHNKMKMCKSIFSEYKTNIVLKPCSVSLPKCHQRSLKDNRTVDLEMTKLNDTEESRPSNSEVDFQMKPCVVNLTRVVIREKFQHLDTTDTRIRRISRDSADYKKYGLKPCSVNLTKCHNSRESKEPRSYISNYSLTNLICSTPNNRSFKPRESFNLLSPISIATANKRQKLNICTMNVQKKGDSSDPGMGRKLCSSFETSDTFVASDTCSNGTEFASQKRISPDRKQNVNDDAESDIINQTGLPSIVSPVGQTLSSGFECLKSNASFKISVGETEKGSLLAIPVNFVTTRRARGRNRRVITEKKLPVYKDHFETCLQPTVKDRKNEIVKMIYTESDLPERSSEKFNDDATNDIMQSDLVDVNFARKSRNFKGALVQEVSQYLNDPNLKTASHSYANVLSAESTWNSTTSYDATSNELGNVGSYSEVSSSVDGVSDSLKYQLLATQGCNEQYRASESTSMFPSEYRISDECITEDNENMSVDSCGEEIAGTVEESNEMSIDDFVNGMSSVEMSENNLCYENSDQLQNLEQFNGDDESGECSTVGKCETPVCMHEIGENLLRSTSYRINESPTRNANISLLNGPTRISPDASIENVSNNEFEIHCGWSMDLSNMALDQRVKLLYSRINTRRCRNTRQNSEKTHASRCNKSKERRSAITSADWKMDPMDPLQVNSVNTPVVSKDSGIENERFSSNDSNPSRDSSRLFADSRESPRPVDPKVMMTRLNDNVRITRERRPVWDLKLSAISESKNVNSPRMSFLPTEFRTSGATENMTLSSISDTESVSIRESLKVPLNKTYSERSANVSLCERIQRQSVFLMPGKQWARSLSILNHVQNGRDLEILCARKGKNWRESVQTVLDMQQQGVIQSCVKKNEDDKESQSRYGALNHGASPNRIPDPEDRSNSSASPSRFTRRMSIRVVPDNKNFSYIEDTNFLEAYGITASKSRKTLSRRSNLKPRRETLEVYNVQCEDVGIETNETGPPVITAQDVVLQRCCQDDYLPFTQCFPETYLECCRKIGEGVYGEVFLFEDEKEKSVVKIIPIEGSELVNGEPQKRFDEILSEIVIAKELHNLRFDERFNTCGFAEVKNIRCIIGKYPEKLVELWELYNEEKGSDNDCPSMFDETQLYIALELGHGGQDLEAFVFQTAAQSHALFIQAALALAVAEQSLEFEHRDLHWGNILISNTEDPQICYKLHDTEFQFASKGVRVAIIDFTLSRMSYEGCCIFNDLALDPALFTAQGEYQFEIYRLMREKIGNDWQKFEPYTNILWLHYTLDKMITAVRYRRKTTKVHKSAICQLQELKEVILTYKSAHDFVTNCDKVTSLRCSTSTTSAVASLKVEIENKENAEN